jgi:hypothetical protein
MGTRAQGEPEVWERITGMEAPMAYQFLAMQQEGRVLKITLNRPPTNALNREFGQEISRAFGEAAPPGRRGSEPSTV